MSDAERGPDVARNAAVTSISQGISMLAGGVLAVLVAVLIGNDARTDGFFAAYGVYAVAVLFAQSTRMSIVARIVEPGGFDRFFGAALLIFTVCGVAFVGFGGPLTDLLTGDLSPVAADTARTALLVLWPAIGGQLFGALAAALLATHDDFTTPALAFGGGGIVSIAAFLLLEPGMGIDAVSVAILIGSTLTGVVLLVRVLRTGWRPDMRPLLRVADNARAAGVMVLSSLAFLIAQLGYLVSIAVAAHLGPGTVTVYSYSYAAMALVIALLASVPSIVLAAPLATTWDRRPSGLLPHHRRVWLAGLLLLIPVAAAGWLVGDDVAGALLTKFTDAEVDLTVELFLILLPTVPWSIAASLPQTALYTVGRYRVVAVIAGVVVVLQAAISILAGAIDDVDLLAAAVPIAGTLSVVWMLWALSPAYLRSALPMLVGGLLRAGAIAAVVFGPPALLLPDPAAYAAGLVLFAAAVAVLPAERDLARRILGAVRRPAAAPVS
jgi:peptidoglycan biosynthesis protein MviN/MurJ (putative lipid II flippase)